MTLDAYPSLSEVEREIAQSICNHNTTEYQPPEPENNVPEDNICVECGISLHIPQIDDNV